MSDAELEILLLSLRVAVASMAILVVPAVALGWLLARKRFFGKGILDAVVHLPLVLPPVVTGYLLLLLFARHGPLGAPLARLGIEIAFNWKGAALASAAMALPLMVRAVRLAVELVDQRLEDAASTLGASPLAVMLTITLPLASPGILAGAVLAFARSLGEFGATFTLAGDIPGESRTIPVAIYSGLQEPYGEAMVARLVLIALALSVAALAGSEYLARRLPRSAVAP